MIYQTNVSLFETKYITPTQWYINRFSHFDELAQTDPHSFKSKTSSPKRMERVALAILFPIMSSIGTASRMIRAISGMDFWIDRNVTLLHPFKNRLKRFGDNLITLLKQPFLLVACEMVILFSIVFQKKCDPFLKITLAILGPVVYGLEIKQLTRKVPNDSKYLLGPYKNLHEELSQCESLINPLELSSHQSIPTALEDDILFSSLTCPISRSPIRIPIWDPNGKSIYDSTSILELIESSQGFAYSPITRERLPDNIKDYTDRALLFIINLRLSIIQLGLQKLLQCKDISFEEKPSVFSEKILSLEEDSDFLHMVSTCKNSHKLLCPITNKFILNPVHHKGIKELVVDQRSILDIKKDGGTSITLGGESYAIDSFDTKVSLFEQNNRVEIYENLFLAYSVFKKPTESLHIKRNFAEDPLWYRCPITQKPIAFLAYPLLPKDSSEEDQKNNPKYEWETLNSLLRTKSGLLPPNWPTSIPFDREHIHIDSMNAHLQEAVSYSTKNPFPLGQVFLQDDQNLAFPALLKNLPEFLSSLPRLQKYICPITKKPILHISKPLMFKNEQILQEFIRISKLREEALLQSVELVNGIPIFHHGVDCPDNSIFFNEESLLEDPKNTTYYDRDALARWVRKNPNVKPPGWPENLPFGPEYISPCNEEQVYIYDVLMDYAEKHPQHAQCNRPTPILF